MTFADGGALLIEVDCTWLPAKQIGRMLFGEESGDRIYRGFVERANGGTLFLDDIGELPAIEQARLVTVLDSMRFRRQMGTHEVSVKLRLAGSVRGSAEIMARSGRLRRDLLARLSVFPIVLT
jgi:DNA-binding NtrC family response regulator